MELVFVICQLASADVCEQHRAPVYTQSPFACLFGAPAELPNLIPAGWQIAKWRCESDHAQTVAMDASPTDH